MLKTLPRNTQVPLQCCIKRCSLKGKLRLRVNLFIRPSMPLFGCVGTLNLNWKQLFFMKNDADKPTLL